MTQEELDALMNGDIDMDVGFEEAEEAADVSVPETSSEEASDDDHYNQIDPDKYRVSAMHSWPPPPPTDDNKMVHQLDDVTKESEQKASEIFDLIEGISNDLGDGEKNIKAIQSVVKSNVELFSTLSEKFPHIEAFKTQLAENKKISDELKDVLEMLQNGGDTIMNIMDIMQYQDIHRQKIERVINVMRALSTYMNHLFAGKIDDAKRVTSAVHIHGDTTTEDVVSSDDIEALLASFGKK
ncbi:MAG: chemotaxis protein [Sulfuricurvum sp. PD_MW2]|jgi:chemotaxis regulatin CheY-phosphate phosphatase CheZ|uniref:chemotaxis protein n=1 Tax=Sulfuricurvum sp. PD_MW2 TaxID=2027917 RepID=UPI000C06786C|nr:chemotaxis protein [Sulfuricurvum sp. PD_MW2]PHM17645.1 MAG: chemotaxis protein [Sulfuricurvum sp. PD_MW2]